MLIVMDTRVRGYDEKDIFSDPLKNHTCKELITIKFCR